MTDSAPNLMSFSSGPAKPEKMLTVVCTSCRMALYMSDRALHMPTWKCPSCGAITRP